LVSDLTALQRTLLRLVGIPAVTYTRFSSPLDST